MPVTAPEIKVKSVKRFGSKVLLYGDSFDQAVKKAKQMAKEQSLNSLKHLMILLLLLGRDNW